MINLFNIFSLKEVETRRRIRLALWAFAYEFENDPLVPDGTFDDECKKVNLQITTDNAIMDKWWRENFNPSTGQWIRKHPELEKIRKIYENTRI